MKKFKHKYWQEKKYDKKKIDWIVFDFEMYLLELENLQNCLRSLFENSFLCGKVGHFCDHDVE